MMLINNIALQIKKSKEPVVRQIYALAHKSLQVIGLGHGVTLDQALKVDKAKLLVIQGEIDFNTASQSYRLERFDSFEIPKNVDHQIVGVFDAIFLLFTSNQEAPQNGISFNAEKMFSNHQNSPKTY